MTVIPFFEPRVGDLVQRDSQCPFRVTRVDVEVVDGDKWFYAYANSDFLIATMIPDLPARVVARPAHEGDVLVHSDGTKCGPITAWDASIIARDGVGEGWRHECGLPIDCKIIGTDSYETCWIPKVPLKELPSFQEPLEKRAEFRWVSAKAFADVCVDRTQDPDAIRRMARQMGMQLNEGETVVYADCHRARIGEQLAEAGLLAAKVQEVARSFWNMDEDIRAHVARVADHVCKGDEEPDYYKLLEAYERAWEIDALGLRSWWEEKALAVLAAVHADGPDRSGAPVLWAFLNRKPGVEEKKP